MMVEISAVDFAGFAVFPTGHAADGRLCIGCDS